MLVAIPNQPKHMLSVIDIIPELVPKEQIFDSIEDCLAWLKETEKV